MGVVRGAGARRARRSRRTSASRTRRPPRPPAGPRWLARSMILSSMSVMLETWCTSARSTPGSGAARRTRARCGRGRCGGRRRPSARRRTSTPGPARGARARRPVRMRCRGGAARRYGNATMSPQPSRKSRPSTGWRRSGARAGRPTAPTASTARGPRAEVYSIDTPPPTVSGSLHVGPRVLLHPHRHRRPLPAHAGHAGLLPDGVGRQRPAHRAPGAELLRRALRPVAPLRPRPSSRPRTPARSSSVAVSRPNFVELCHRLTAEDEKAFEDAVAPPRPVGRLDASPTPPSASESQRVSPAGLPAPPGRGLGLPGRGARPCGTSTSRRRWPRPSWRTASVPGAYHRIRFGRHRDRDRHHPARADPACVALVAHPDDERYQPLGSARPCATPLFGVEVPVVAHELADPEKGSGIAMICTFGDVTDVVWWRELSLPVRSHAGPRRPRPGRARPTGVARPTRRGTELAGARREAGPGRASSSCCGEPATWSASPGPSPTRSSSTRRATARSRSSPAASGSSARARPPRRRCWPGAGSCAGTRPTCRPATRTGSTGLNSDWLVSRQRFFGVPVPALVPGSATTASPDYDEPIVPAEAAPARRPVHRRARPATTERPAGPAGRLHRRPRRHGHVGHVVADAPDRRPLGATTPTCSPRVFPMDVRPQGHEIIRTWLFSTVVRSHLEHDGAAVDRRRHLGLDPRPRPQEDVEVEGQRRHAHGRCSSSTAPTPSATGRPAAGPAPTPPSTRAR